jgi:hypothetical protein
VRRTSIEVTSTLKEMDHSDRPSDSDVSSEPDSSSSQFWSHGSTETSRHVGFTRSKSTCNRDLKLVGFIQGLGLFMWTYGDWVTGAFADQMNLTRTLNIAINQARSCGHVRMILIIKEHSPRGDLAASDAHWRLREAFPGAHIETQSYPPIDSGDYVFQTHRDRPGVVSRLHYLNR